MTVRDLLKVFDESYVQGRLKNNTIRGYRVNYNHIISFMGDVDLALLDLSDIDSFVSYLRSNSLGNTTIRYVLSVLRKALNFAVKRGYVKYNVLLNYDFPRADRYFYEVLDEGQLEQLCMHLVGDDIFPCVLLAGFYGLRRGEILGLRICDVSKYEDKLVISVQHSVSDVKGIREFASCKNDFSCRKILLSDFHSLLLAQYLKKRSALKKSNYLVCSTNGDFVTSNCLNYRFKKALFNLGLPDIRFHDLRHSYATMMLRSGVHPKIVSSVLGHSDVGTTLNIYSHADISMQRACLEVVDRFTKKEKGAE